MSAFDELWEAAVVSMEMQGGSLTPEREAALHALCREFWTIGRRELLAEQAELRACLEAFTRYAEPPGELHDRARALLARTEPKP